ncbi:MAG: hypothetical protein ACREK2_09970 [Gemmatimonadota bacterium]
MIDHALTALQRWIRAHALFYRLTLGTRVLLAVGFIPTGMVKLLGRRFAFMSPETPIGGFFETLYLSGPYWRFLGLAQVLAGVLVLVPATATLGALMFFTIMINVFIITLSYEFHFTPFVTGAMLTATLYLLMWDYDRLRGLVGFGASSEAESRPMPRHRLSGPVERGAYIAGALAGLGFFFGTRGLFVPWSWNQWFLLVCGISLLVALWFGLVRRARPVGSGLE